MSLPREGKVVVCQFVLHVTQQFDENQTAALFSNGTVRQVYVDLGNREQDDVLGQAVSIRSAIARQCSIWESVVVGPLKPALHHAFALRCAQSCIRVSVNTYEVFCAAAAKYAEFVKDAKKKG